MDLAYCVEIPAPRSARPFRRAVVLAGVFSATVAGCGPQGHYFRGDAGSSGGRDAAATGDAPVGGDGAGTGGQFILATGGTVGPATGGAPGSGGAATGGLGVGTGGGTTTGGNGTATGGAGTGGAGTGGAGTGGVAATGGSGTGGAATGGMGTGGAGTGGAGGAGPRIVSIDFVGGMLVAAGGAGGSSLFAVPMLAPAEVAGYKQGTNWNAAAGPMGTLAALKLTDGSITTITATWNSPLTASNPGVWWNHFVDVPGDVRMMNGYLDPTSTTAPAVVTVTGLPTTITAPGYDVYVYAMGDVTDTGTRVYSYTIGNTTVMVSQTGRSTGIFAGFTLVPAAGGTGNVVVFRNLTGASFTLTARPVSGTPRAPVNGIQIVSPRGS